MTSPSTVNERSPLQPKVAPDVSPAFGTATFPFHPMAYSTPWWRTLLLQYFDGHGKDTALDESDVWPLAPALCGSCPADRIRSHLPSSGRFRLARAVWRAHAARLLWIIALDVVAMAIAVLRPLLLYDLFQSGLVKTGAASSASEGQPGPTGTEMRVAIVLATIFLAEIALALVRGQRRRLTHGLDLEVNRGLFGMIMDRVVGSGDMTFASQASDSSSTGAIGHKQRLTEVAQMLSRDLNASLRVMSLADTWPMASRWVVSLVVLVRVVDIPWTLACAAVGVYALMVTVETVLGLALSAPFMSAATKRVNTVRECLKSIQMIKLSGWEAPAESKIQQARSSEVSRWGRLTTVMLLINDFVRESPMLIAAFAFTWLTSRGVGTTGEHTAILAQVFIGLILFKDIANSGEQSLLGIPVFIVSLAAWHRIERYVLNSDKRREQSKTPPESTGSSTPPLEEFLFEMRGVCIEHTAQKATSSPPLLVNVDWRVRRGELVVVHGAAGMGKSTLLAALRGENAAVQVTSGSFCGVSSNCRVAYCSQEPWLQTKSIRENIVFDTEFDAKKYWTIVDACGLLEDLTTLPVGDETIVGSSGINLSGGQSARIALARACYADADLYLLDCPLANVDAVVQSEIFRKCIVKLLMFKTVVIVTHNPEYIGSSYVDQLVEVKQLAVQMKTRSPPASVKSSADGYITMINRRMRDDSDALVRWSLGDRQIRLYPLPRDARGTIREIEAAKSKLHTSETLRLKEDGTSVDPFAVVKEYVLSAGARGWVWLICVVVTLVTWGVICGARDMWIMMWANRTTESSRTADATTTYSYLVGASIALGIGVQYCVTQLNMMSASQLFSKMTHAVIHAPMDFFYITPVGVAVNRFYIDVMKIDTAFPMFAVLLLQKSVEFIVRAVILVWLLGGYGAIVTSIGYGIMLWMLSIGFFTQLTTMAYEASEMQISFLSETLDGERVVRAFGERSMSHVLASLRRNKDTNDRIQYTLSIFNSCVILRVQVVVAIVGLGYTMVLAFRPTTPAELLLVVLNMFMLQNDFTMDFATALVTTCVEIRAIKRMQEYAHIATQLETEWTPASSGSVEISSELWPAVGSTEFQGVSFAYTDNAVGAGATLALRDVSFSIHGGENIGIIGRTGSGKSSLAMALLRVHPLRSGRILLDGVDLRTVPLTRLRRSFTMIPQSPTFYRCSIRDYLDPFHEYDDARLWRELLTVDLGARVQSLDEELLDNGENWSLGQRQLLCFARALLKPSRVVVLDEAFSCVDQSCQEKILRILRERFASSTVILITHRLDQILEFDRILVMCGGRLVESGSASELASDASSLFYEFLETSLLTF